MSTFLTIISGITVFVLGEIALKIFIEPWQKQRECIARIGNHLTLYANVYSNPGIGNCDLNLEASKESRKIAAELFESCHRIPFYDFFSGNRVFPSKDIISQVHGSLIALSNSTQTGKPFDNDDRIEKIKNLLKLHID